MNVSEHHKHTSLIQPSQLIPAERQAPSRFAWPRQSRPDWQQVVEHFRRERVLQATERPSTDLSSSLRSFVQGRASSLLLVANKDILVASLLQVKRFPVLAYTDRTGVNIPPENDHLIASLGPKEPPHTPLRRIASLSLWRFLRRRWHRLSSALRSRASRKRRQVALATELQELMHLLAQRRAAPGNPPEAPNVEEKEKSCRSTWEVTKS